MARIRTIKPEFFTSEDIVELSPLARLLYIALWCEADREGRLNWKPRTLKMKYLPAESCDVMLICDELVSSNLVTPYVIDGETYAVLPTFKKHQAINVREAQSSIPAPPDGVHVHAREKDAWSVNADTRATVLARDAHKCVRCGSSDHLQIDHIFPKSMGGTSAITNLRVLCRSCNAGRPVCGQGLIDDLAIDGLTLNDMHRMCMHVQGDGEGKGREGKGKEGKEEEHSCTAPSATAPAVKQKPSSKTETKNVPLPDEPIFLTIPLNNGKEFPVTEAQVAEFSSLYPAVDVPQTLRSIRAWAIANPSKRKTQSGAMRFVNAWLAKEQNRGGQVVALANSPERRSFREVSL